MERIISIIVRFIDAAQLAYGRKWSLFGVFAFAFVGSIVVLGRLDLLPTAAAPQEAFANNLEQSEPIDQIQHRELEEPVKIEIPRINLMASISNPNTTNIEALDADLLRGAVRYPTSAKLGEIGNVVLFAHSSYLPIVGNPAYKTFNGIQKLKAGDVITLYSSDMAYTYTVRSVAKESAAADASIALDVTTSVLTLSTCDSFGVKTDRFIVTADFVDSHSIRS